ncbi:hypothetical protein ACFL2Q_13265 [Thermodesulfobacteriota bacterium]
MDVSLEDLHGCDVSFLPIVAAFVKRIGIWRFTCYTCGSGGTTKKMSPRVAQGAPNGRL